MSLVYGRIITINNKPSVKQISKMEADQLLLDPKYNYYQHSYAWIIVATYDEWKAFNER